MFPPRALPTCLACACLLAAATAPRCAAQKPKDWTSGEIVSRDASFKYGAYEVSLKASQGPGAITGFILITPASGSGGAWQELAIEVFGKGDGHQYQTQVITPGPPEVDDPAHEPRTQHIKTHSGPANLWDTYNTLRMEFLPSKLRFLVNGNVVREETDAGEFAQFLAPGRAQPMNIRLTLWAGFSEWSGQVDPSKPPTDASLQYMRYEKYDEATGKLIPGWEDTFDSFDGARWQKADWTFPFAVTQFQPANVYTEGGALHFAFKHA